MKDCIGRKENDDKKDCEPLCQTLKDQGWPPSWNSQWIGSSTLYATQL